MLFDVTTNQEEVRNCEEQVGQTVLGSAGCTRRPASRGAPREVGHWACRRERLSGGLPGSLGASRRCSGRFPRVAGLAAFPQRLLLVADHPFRLAGAHPDPPCCLLDAEQQGPDPDQECADEDQPGAVVPPRPGRIVDPQRRCVRCPAVRHRPVGADRAHQLGCLPQRALGCAAVRVAELAHGERLGQLQRPPAADLFRHRLHRRAPGIHHGRCGCPRPGPRTPRR